MAKSHAGTNIKWWSYCLRFSHLLSSCRPENIFVTDSSGIDSAYPCWSHKLFENDKRKHDFSSRSVERTPYNRHNSTLHNACPWPCRHKSSTLRLHHRRLHKKNEVEHGYTDHLDKITCAWCYQHNCKRSELFITTFTGALGLLHTIN